ncbi:MAG: NFACT RNA binding domain-containing protein [Calditerrivibrio sp.]|nr:NFACT RNA binding domain-containing protein [Calditerrivibrio sp.]
MDGLLLFKFINFLKKKNIESLNKVLLNHNMLCLIFYVRSEKIYLVFDVSYGWIFFKKEFDGKEIFSKVNSSKIVEIKQKGYDRLFYIKVAKQKISGDYEVYKLVFEVVGGNSNFFILDEKNIILFNLTGKNIDADRVINIGTKYQPFKSNKRFSLDNTGNEKDFSKYEGFYKKTTDFANKLVEVVGDFDDAVDLMKLYLHEDTIYLDEFGKAYPFNLTGDLLAVKIDEYIPPTSTNESKDAQQLLKQIKNKISQKLSTLSKVEKELEAAECFQHFLDQAEMIKNNLYRIDEALKSGEFFMFDEELIYKVKLELEVKVPIQKYIEELYNEGKRLERALPIIQKRITSVKQEIDYLNELIYFIENGLIDHNAVNSILKPSQKKEKIPITRAKNYYKYRSNDWILLVGKNSLGNDEILKLSDKDDLWFHVKDAPSSHVVLKITNSVPTDDLIKTVCSITAFFSKFKSEKNVLVDWTEKRYVRKVKGGAPGFVIYDRFKTMAVSPTAPEDLGFYREDIR